MTWLPPELELGAEPELKPLELELELELEPFELEPLELEPLEPEPEEPEPELVEPEPEDEPELVELPVDEPDDVEEDAVLCVDPGRTSATTPAAATLAMVTVVVADRTLARPRSLSAIARRTRSRCALLMFPILRPYPQSLAVRNFSVSYEANPPAPSPWLTLPREHEGQLKTHHLLRPARSCWSATWARCGPKRCVLISAFASAGVYARLRADAREA
jgi:hypothetical protein